MIRFCDLSVSTKRGPTGPKHTSLIRNIAHFTLIKQHLMIQSVLKRQVHVGVFIGVIILILYVPIMLHLMNFPAVFPVYGDGQYYVVLADNLLQHGIFSGSLTAPFLPATFVMPVYPFLLALFKGIFGSYMLFPLVQMILVGATSFLIFKIGERAFSYGVGLVAALLFIVDPTTIMQTMTIMTDITYTFFLVLAVYFLFANEAQHQRVVFFSGAFLGLAMLTRVISMFLPILIVPLYFFLKRGELPLKKIVINVLILALAYAAVVMPWVARNRIVSGVWGIAAEKSLNLFQYYVPEFLSYTRGISADEGRKLLMLDLALAVGGKEIKDAGSLEYAAVEEKIALGYVWRDMFGYAKFHLIKTIPFFLSSGLKNVMIYYNDAVGYRAFETNTGNLTTLFFHGRFGEFLSELRVSPLVTIEQIFWFVIAILATIGVLFSRKSHRVSAMCLGGLVLYFAILTGPMAYSRFRLPAAPFLFLLAAVGVTVLGRAVSKFSKQSISQ